jgi:hypothetical protein
MGIQKFIWNRGELFRNLSVGGGGNFLKFAQYGGFSIRRKTYYFSRIRNEYDADYDRKT